MKYLKTFENNYLDSLLDKINDSGYDSLSELEKNWLKAHAEDKEKEMSKIERELGVKEYMSSNNLFSFKFIDMEDYGDYQIYKGTMHVPSIEFEDGKKIDGTLEGEIEVRDGLYELNFEKKWNNSTYDIWEFCEGLENELNDFIYYIIDDLTE